MKAGLSSIFSLFWILSMAQEAQVDSVNVEAPTAVVDSLTQQKGFLIRPVILVDYGKLVSTAVGFDKKYEGSLQLLFYNKLELVGEFGMADLAPENAYSNGNYNSSGSYYRVGAGVYSQLNPKSKLGIGLRYAQASFEDQGFVEIESQSGLQDGYSRPYGDTGLEATWGELVLTSESLFAFKKSVPEAKINQMIALGFQFRMRFLFSYDQRSPIDVYAIPGYGNTLNDQRSAVNLFLKFYPF